MTEFPLPVTPLIDSARRRGGGAGEPAAHPVPPPAKKAVAERPGKLGAALGFSDQTGYRLGPAGLVVVIAPAALAAACAQRGWSLTYLAKRAGVSYPTLKSTLRGRAVRPRTAWKLARALGEGTAAVELDYLTKAS